MRLWAVVAAAPLLVSCGSSSDAAKGGAAKPAYLDDSKSAEAMVPALGDAFCADPISKQAPLLSGETLAQCQSKSSNRVLLFRVFNSTTERRLYMDNQQCQTGLYYERGPTWIATATSTTDAAALEDKGAQPLTCG